LTEKNASLTEDPFGYAQDDTLLRISLSILQAAFALELSAEAKLPFFLAPLCLSGKKRTINGSCYILKNASLKEDPEQVQNDQLPKQKG
jgi:hypothetical protein